MAITFPRDLPAGIDFEPARFRLTDHVAVTGDVSGAMAHMETQSPAWTIRFVSGPLVEKQVQEFEAWRETLRGGLGRVLVTQNVTCRPIAHEAVAAPAQDTGIVSVVNGASVTVTGLSAALVLAPGDLAGFSRVDGGKTYRALARIAEASPAGATTRTLVFTRVPRTYGCAVNATVTFENPMLAMAATAGSSSLALSDDAMPVASLDLTEVMQ